MNTPVSKFEWNENTVDELLYHLTGKTKWVHSQMCEWKDEFKQSKQSTLTEDAEEKAFNAAREQAKGKYVYNPTYAYPTYKDWIYSQNKQPLSTDTPIPSKELEKRYSEERYPQKPQTGTDTPLRDKEGKDWEILSYEWECGIYTLNDKGIYVHPPHEGSSSPIHLTAYSEKTRSIHSVRRKDGEVFTVLDNTSHGKIYAFEIAGKEMITKFSDTLGFANINFISKKSTKPTPTPDTTNKPLFTTEDGVEIRETDRPYYVVDFKINGTADLKRNKNFHPATYAKYFSTKEAAEQYILENKPCLSLNDLLEAWHNWDERKELHFAHAYQFLRNDVKYNHPLFKKFTEKAIEKLKQ